MNDRYAHRAGLFGLVAIVSIVTLIWLASAGALHLSGAAVATEENEMLHSLPKPSEIASLPPDGGPEFNRLVFETSPYLLQHADNPVDWHPWSAATLELAQEQDKPIFLSVGYSTCHWCHVMARESFQRDDVAEILNEHYIPVKVDREELPDVDATYMTATQLLTGSGGWPNSVWLTPDGQPFFAATYVPRSQFKQLLLQLRTTYTQKPAEVREVGAEVMAAIEQTHKLEQAAADYEPSIAGLDKALKQALTMYDPKHGGLGTAPKFPPHGTLAALAYELYRRPDEQRLKVFTHTLDSMARGGIHDHLAGGFHRYATDNAWLLPHFEKMLYDNAQLARAYSDAYLLTGDERYREVTEGICDWVLSDLTDPAGGFWSAMDAESEGEEGKSYVWTIAEVQAVLGTEDGVLFADVYGFTPEGNYFEEASGQRTGANVIHLPRPLYEVAQKHGLEPAELAEKLTTLRGKLLEARGRRPQPHVDDKVLTSWNGLMIGALAYVGRVLTRPDYIAAAERAADFVLAELRVDKHLMHTWRKDEARVPAHSDDYAFLIDGLLDLHQTTGKDKWLSQAELLTQEMLWQFGDKDGALFYTARDTATSPLRRKDSTDDVVPSGNGMAARALVRLALISGDEEYEQRSRALLAAVSGAMAADPHRTESLQLAAAMLAERQESPGRGRPQERARSAKGPVTLRAGLRPDGTVRPGETVELGVLLTLDDGYHVNALAGRNAAPVDDTELVPTTISLGGPDWAAIDAELKAPQPELLSFAGQAERLPGYEGSVRFSQAITVPADAAVGKHDLTITVQVQPCDDSACLLPQTHELTLTLEVTR